MEDQEKTTSWYQQNALEVLLEFQRVCEELGLRFYLTAGTLLGAIRHKGFIPWDDDIDVAMPREDYDKLARIGPKCFSEKYFYQDYRTEPNFPLCYAKLRKRGTVVSNGPIMDAIRMEQGCYIDIFPLDFCPDGDRTATLFFKGMAFFKYVTLGRVSTEFVCLYEKRIARLFWNILKRFPNHWLFFLRECFRKMMRCFSTGEKLCTVGGRHGYPKETYCAEWWKEIVPVQFEGYVFPAPAGWDMQLRSMYGDYMVLPSEEERERHFI